MTKRREQAEPNNSRNEKRQQRNVFHGNRGMFWRTILSTFHTHSHCDSILSPTPFHTHVVPRIAVSAARCLCCPLLLLPNCERCPAASVSCTPIHCSALQCATPPHHAAHPNALLTSLHRPPHRTTHHIAPPTPGAHLASDGRSYVLYTSLLPWEFGLFRNGPSWNQPAPRGSCLGPPGGGLRSRPSHSSAGAC